MKNSSKINWSQYHKPIVLEGKDPDLNYLLKDELDKILKKVNEFHELYKKSSKDIDFETPMNIGISGERGSGKTSLLKTLKNKLEDKNYYVFDIIDPNLLSSDLNVLEIIISNIYQKVTQIKLDDIYINQKIINKLKTVMKALSIQRQGTRYFNKDNPSIDMLDEINDVVNLGDILNEILDSFKEILNIYNKNKEYKDLVLIIDDLDLLENDHIYKFLSQIQEYLNTKVIIIFAYREDQLENSLFEKKIKYNENLLDLKKIDYMEVDKQINSILLKLIPVKNRIKLYNQREILDMNYEKIFSSIDINEEQMKSNNLYVEKKDKKNISVEDWIYEKIVYSTKLYIKPVDERESVVLFLPSSLREFIQFAEHIANYKELSNDEEKVDTIIYYKELTSNIDYFKNFFRGRINEHIAMEEKEFIDNWEYATSYQKNYLAFHYFLRKLKDNNTFKDMSKRVNYEKYYFFDLEIVQNFNLRLSDVYEVIEMYKSYIGVSSKDFFPVYYFKVFYSIELLELLIKSLDNILNKNIEIQNDNKNLRAYLELINTSFMPEKFNYFEYTRERDPEDYIFDSHPKELDEKENIIFINSFLNNKLSVSSDIRKGILLNHSSFRYREIYSYNILNFESTELKDVFDNRGRYFIEYYVPVGQKNYVLKALEDIKARKPSVNYLFYSMFHIDNFVRKTYSRRSSSESGKYIYTINIIEGLFKEINEFYNSYNFNTQSKGKSEVKIYPKYFRELTNYRSDLRSPYDILDKYSNDFNINLEKDYKYIYENLFKKLTDETSYEYKIRKDNNTYEINFKKNNKKNKGEFKNTIEKLKEVFNGDKEEDNKVKEIINNIERKFIDIDNLSNFEEYVPDEMKKLNNILEKYRV